MEALQRAFGSVVDAAIAGDLSRRVDDRFADPELNALARSINRLVEVVDQGLTENGRVLAALRARRVGCGRWSTVDSQGLGEQ